MTDSKKVLGCPTCQQRLNVPTDRGELKLTCPNCHTSWVWSPRSPGTPERIEVRPKAQMDREAFYRRLIRGLVRSDFRLRAGDFSEADVIADRDLSAARRSVTRVLSTLAPYMIRASAGIDPPNGLLRGS